MDKHKCTSGHDLPHEHLIAILSDTDLRTILSARQASQLFRDIAGALVNVLIAQDGFLDPFMWRRFSAVERLRLVATTGRTFLNNVLKLLPTIPKRVKYLSIQCPPVAEVDMWWECSQRLISAALLSAAFAAHLNELIILAPISSHDADVLLWRLHKLKRVTLALCVNDSDLPQLPGISIGDPSRSVWRPPAARMATLDSLQLHCVDNYMATGRTAQAATARCS